MTETVLASPESVRFTETGDRHAALARALRVLTEALVAAVRTGEPLAARLTRRDLVAWREQELLPRMGAEEQAIYPAVRSIPASRFLIKALLGEHEDIRAVRSIVQMRVPAHAAGRSAGAKDCL